MYALYIRYVELRARIDRFRRKRLRVTRRDQQAALLATIALTVIGGLAAFSTKIVQAAIAAFQQLH
ncbi:hypothetical protein SAMN05192543_107416 [Paraburkholderia megapolitana]|uniref:Uncharacterized protein n=1 Tax=Paraburkholderia megapolitana TaxID=420953 RepID=A0A1I3RSV3_9BURK|nr:hypothetical protein SAMN05192543_107416 [Paraburkholderia megapolitana]